MKQLLSRRGPWSNCRLILLALASLPGEVSLAITPRPAAVVINELVAVHDDTPSMYTSDTALGPHRIGNRRPWFDPAFDDRTWPSSPLAQLPNNTRSGLYLRTTFTLSPEELPNASARLKLEIAFEGGFVAYLNGKELWRSNLGPSESYTSHDYPATQGFSTTRPLTFYKTQPQLLLQPGSNSLAILIHNNYTTDAFGFRIRTAVPRFQPTIQLILDQQPLVDSTADWQWTDNSHEPGLLRDRLGQIHDWIELRNLEAHPVSLLGWSLTDDPEQPRKWAFPDVTIPASGYLTIFASGLGTSTATELHTNFQLDDQGEYLALWDAQTPARLIDAVQPQFPPQSPFYSWGRDPQTGTFCFLFPATPGEANEADERLGQQVAPPLFSPAGRVADQDQSVALQCPTPNAAIYYTTDGSIPSLTHGLLYTSPITVTQPTAIRARAFLEGRLPSPVQTATYLVNLPREHFDLPALCLTGDPANIFFRPYGIASMRGGTTADAWTPSGLSDYNHMIFHGRIVERPVHVEWFPRFAGDGPALIFPCGIRIAGSEYMRPRYRLGDEWIGVQSQKLSFRLYPRNDYGTATIPNTWMPASPLLAMHQITLRAGHNDWANPFLKDELARRLSLDMGQPAAVGTMCALFINGEYKGFYNPVPRPDEAFFQAFHHSTRAWDVIHIGELKSGSFDLWNEIGTLIATTDPTNRLHYRRLESRVDLTNFVDYLILNSFAAMWDWPQNNWVAARERSPGGRFRYVIWDAEGGWGTHGAHTLDRNTLATDVRAKPETRIGALYSKLRLNPDFRLLFADRVQKHLVQADGALAPANRLRRFSELQRSIALPVSRFYGTFDQSIPTTWFQRRPAIMLHHFQAEGLWDPTLLAPELTDIEPISEIAWQLLVSNPNARGEIWFTLDGSDPRNPLNGLPSTTAAAAATTEPVTATLPARLAARVLAGTEWSPLLEETLPGPPAPGCVVVNEFLADPFGEDDGREWIELHNTTDMPIDINGWILRDNGSDLHAIRHPSPLVIAPRGYLLLAQSHDAAEPDGLPIDYIYGADFQMNKAGDEIVLLEGHRIIDAAAFGDYQKLVHPLPNIIPISPAPGAATARLSGSEVTAWTIATEPYGALGHHGTPGRINTMPTAEPGQSSWGAY